MRLLIVTQAVDLDDPILGFFHRWVEEFAARSESVRVICLREGRHTLPGNVTVSSLGKEHGRAPRGVYAFRFWKLIWALRKEYDAVFVHMNPEYVMLGGPFWKLSGKKVVLWYTHKSVTFALRFGMLFVDAVCTASKESFRLRSSKVRVVGHGIDTDFFIPDPNVAREEWLLSAGRLMPSKRHDIAIRRAAHDNRELHIAGDGPERAPLESLARELGARVTFLGSLTQKRLRDEYRRASAFIHRSETGSLDKVVLEAAACGLTVDSNNPAIARLPLTPEYVREHHSLPRLIERIVQELT